MLKDSNLNFDLCSVMYKEKYLYFLFFFMLLYYFENKRLPLRGKTINYFKRYASVTITF